MQFYSTKFLKDYKMDDVSAALTLIKSLDLTSLNSSDNEETIQALCNKATTPYAKVAAVCLYPQFIPLAKNILPSDIKIATVINFPSGLADLHLLEKEIKTAIKLGADELDVVLPYRTLLTGDTEFCTKYLAIARETTGKKTLKIIIESGELKGVEKISLATRLVIDSAADFVKTSTGKTDVSATPEAANIILETIRQSGKNIGFKASGGIKTLQDAKKYLTLSQSIMGPEWVSPSHLRIGASSVLTSLLATIKQGY